MRSKSNQLLKVVELQDSEIQTKIQAVAFLEEGQHQQPQHLIAIHNHQAFLEVEHNNKLLHQIHKVSLKLNLLKRKMKMLVDGEFRRNEIIN